MNKVEVLKFQADHARDIFSRNRKDGLRTICDGVDEENLISVWLDRGIAYSLVVDIPIGCGGIVDIGFGRGEAWTLISSLFFKYPKTSLKVSRRMLEFIAHKMKLRRVQSMVNESLPRGHNWAKHLGFEKEGLLKSFGPNGENFFMYARIF